MMAQVPISQITGSPSEGKPNAIGLVPRRPSAAPSGATLAAIAQKLADLPANAKVLGFNYDTGERYLSVEGYLPA
jgi:hypothetical protein